MNRIAGTKLLAAVVGLAHLAGGAAARADDPPGKGPAELQGSWKLVSVETDGTANDPVGGGRPRGVIKGDTISYGGKVIIRFTADPASTPRVIDLKFRDPEKVYEGVYVIEKDTLKVCLNGRADAKDRPGAFATKGQPDWRLLVFEREKAAPANPGEGATGYAGVRLRADAGTVVVDAPIKGSPAEKAGLKAGDVILKVGAAAATDLEGTVKAVRQAKPGDKVEFQVGRGGKEVTVTVTVGVFPFHWAVGLE
jgi:uncharacterized protein (TIGR03067 family)